MEKKKESLFDSNFREILASELVSIAGGLIAGSLLAWYTNQLILLPGILILLPGFLEMRGNISGSFASRISSGLFLKVIKPNRIKTHIIKGNLLASFFLALVVSLTLGILAFAFNYFFLQLVTWKIIIIPLIAGIIANAIEIPLTLFTTLYLFKKGYDPNNIMAPFITSTGDVISIVALLIGVFIL